MILYTKKISASEVISNKICTREDLLKLVRVWQFKSEKVVFTNGCFDILHRGHIDYLAKASDLGNELVVAVNSDTSVKLLNKGFSRPIQDEHTRAMILASNHFVSAVIIFDEETPMDLINFLKPDVLVKGADYDENETNPLSKKYIVGSDSIRSFGGEVKTIEFLEGFSTTNIENKIKRS